MFFLNLINKIVLVKLSYARETLILTPNMLKEKWNTKQMSIQKHLINNNNNNNEDIKPNIT